MLLFDQECNLYFDFGTYSQQLWSFFVLKEMDFLSSSSLTIFTVKQHLLLRGISRFNSILAYGESFGLKVVTLVL